MPNPMNLFESAEGDEVASYLEGAEGELALLLIETQFARCEQDRARKIIERLLEKRRAKK